MCITTVFSVTWDNIGTTILYIQWLMHCALQTVYRYIISCKVISILMSMALRDNVKNFINIILWQVNLIKKLTSPSAEHTGVVMRCEHGESRCEAPSIDVAPSSLTMF